MNEMFLEEWRLYRRGSERARLRGEAPRMDAAFDPCVSEGDIRVFADTTRPLLALVISDMGHYGCKIVPVSPFHAPASSREAQIDGRVFQLWNTCRASRRFVSRSWLADRIGANELESLRGRIAASFPGRVTCGDGPVARYEREFLVQGGNFVPFASPRAEKRSFSLPRLNAWGVAASLALMLGIGAAMACWRGADGRFSNFTHYAFRVSEYDTVELAEMEAMREENLIAVQEPSIDFPLALDIPAIPCPAANTPETFRPEVASAPSNTLRVPHFFPAPNHYGERYERVAGEEPLATAASARRLAAARRSFAYGGAKDRKSGEVEARTNSVRRVSAPRVRQSDDVRVDVTF